MPHTRLPALDLLRFVAALAVVLFHLAFRGSANAEYSVMPVADLDQVAKYGFVGVHLFFMISGYVILMSASAGRAWRFVVSRLCRLYPAFWLCCTLTALVILFAGDARFSVSVSQYLANMTMLVDGAVVEPIDGVYWSLFVELRFYFLVFLLIVFRQIQRVDLVLPAWLVACALFRQHSPYSLQLLLVLDYAPYFIGGAAFYRLSTAGYSALRVTTLLGSLILCAVLITEESGIVARNYSTPIDRNVVLGLLLSFFLAFGWIAGRRATSRHRPGWALLGALTYPLYLVHQNVGYIAINRLYPAAQAMSIDSVPSRLIADATLGLTVAGTLLLAWAIHRVEVPASQHLKRWLSRIDPAASRVSAA